MVRILLIWSVSAIVAAMCTWLLLLNVTVSTEQNASDAPICHDIPEEVLCLSAASAREDIPQSVTSDKPLIRLREYENGKFELLYWGNPVRPSYAFSITRLSTGASVLLNAEGKRENMRDLPVTVPRRADKALPLQPPVKLHHLENKSGCYYAAKISVHDASTGKVLASAIYLINGYKE